MATVASPELSFFRPASRINPWIHDGADQKSRSIWNGNNGAVSAQRMRYIWTLSHHGILLQDNRDN